MLPASKPFSRAIGLVCLIAFLTVVLGCGMRGASPPTQVKIKRPKPADEPDLPKVQTRMGMIGPDSFDEAIEWLQGGNQTYQLIACGSLAKAKVYLPRQDEVCRSWTSCCTVETPWSPWKPAKPCTSGQPWPRFRPW